MSSSDNEVIVAAVALVVSLIALAATILQVTQQYVASARGYSQCNEKVMGLWAFTKSRRFSWEELRFEVEFDAPVIFLCPPTNTKGPVPDTEMILLDGSDKSLQDSWTTLVMNTRNEYAEKTPREKIHTADNERASWLVMLSAIQRMERDAREWQEEEYKQRKPPAKNQTTKLPTTPPKLLESHTLSVALQKKRKSWDTMPPSMTKPYATTTICHLIELLGALGVYWKEFDRKMNRYRAEGNGLMVTGEKNSDLGLMFSFQVYGECRFKENRVAPHDSIKSFCFGFVPTIYQSTVDSRRLRSPLDAIEDLTALQMASINEFAETLVMIGCNNKTVHSILEEDTRTSHIFPLSFEIVGMLSETLHIRNTYFTYVPNPTPDRWDKRKVSLPKLLEAYQEELRGGGGNTSPVQDRIDKHIDGILKYHYYGDNDDQDADEGPDRLQFLEALHGAIDDVDEILTAKPRRGSGSSAATTTTPTKEQSDRREMVQDILRGHIQELLRLLNPERRAPNHHRQSLQVPDRDFDRLERERSPTSPISRRGLPAYDDHQQQQQQQQQQMLMSTPQFEDMDAASPDDRQHKMMEVYFRVVRRHAVPRATASTSRRASIASARSRTPSPSASSRRLHVNANTNPGGGGGGGGSGNNGGNGEVERPGVTHDDVWLALVFRMVCWLMLHDFSKQDVQIPKSELYGNRMPVYIT